MTGIVLVRHTRPGVESGICYGRLDVPLARTWRRDVQQCLAGIPPVTNISSSPLRRCRILAEAVGARDAVAVEEDFRLLELDVGAWEGRRWDEIARAEIDDWAADTLNYAPGGGESLHQLWHRVVPVLQRCESSTFDRLLIVTHLGPLRVLAAHSAGLRAAAALAIDIPWGGMVQIRSRGLARRGG